MVANYITHLSIERSLSFVSQVIFFVLREREHYVNNLQQRISTTVKNIHAHRPFGPAVLSYWVFSVTPLNAHIYVSIRYSGMYAPVRSICRRGPTARSR